MVDEKYYYFYDASTNIRPCAESDADTNENSPKPRYKIKGKNIQDALYNLYETIKNNPNDEQYSLGLTHLDLSCKPRDRSVIRKLFEKRNDKEDDSYLNLTGCNISGNNLMEVTANNINFSYCNMDNCNFLMLTAQNCSFDYIESQNNDKNYSFKIDGDNFDNCSFVGTYWIKSKVDDSHIYEHDFQDDIDDKQNMGKSLSKEFSMRRYHRQMNVYDDASKGFKSDNGIWDQYSKIDKRLSHIAKEHYTNMKSSQAQKKLVAKFSSILAFLIPGVVDAEKQLSTAKHTFADNVTSNKEFNTIMVNTMQKATDTEKNKLLKFLGENVSKFSNTLTSSRNMEMLIKYVKSQLDTTISTSNAILAKKITFALESVATQKWTSHEVPNPDIFDVNNNGWCQNPLYNTLNVFLCNHEDARAALEFMIRANEAHYIVPDNRNGGDYGYMPFQIVQNKSREDGVPSYLIMTRDKMMQAIYLDKEDNPYQVVQYSPDGNINKIMEISSEKDEFGNVIQKVEDATNRRNNYIADLKRNVVVERFVDSLCLQSKNIMDNDIKNRKDSAFAPVYDPQKHFMSYSHGEYKVFDISDFKSGPKLGNKIGDYEMITCIKKGMKNPNSNENDLVLVERGGNAEVVTQRVAMQMIEQDRTELEKFHRNSNISGIGHP